MKFFSRNGFTILELIVVIGIIATVAIIALPSLLGQKNQNVLTTTDQEMVSALRLAQAQAVDQLLDVPWGVHFVNATNTNPYTIIFAGSSYASGTPYTYSALPKNVGFVTSTLPIGSSMDVVFASISGAATTTQIGLYLLSQPSLTFTIQVSSSGFIQ